MSTRRPIRIATRGSALALWQANHVADALGVEFELIIIKTHGDKTQKANVPIESMRGRGVFVKEVQGALFDESADIAVHSAKDLPSITEEGLCLGAILERGDPRDCLIGKALDEIPSGGMVGTGSVRRRAQMASLRPDLTFSNLRGNVDTRLEKAKTFDAIVMAKAGIERIRDTSELSMHVLEPSVMLPQVGQGALAVECREGDTEMIELLQTVNHTDSRRAVDAERAFLGELGGSCDLPVGAYATISNDEVHMRTLIASLDGRIVLRREGCGFDGVELGQGLAKHLLYQDGAAELLLDRVSQ